MDLIALANELLAKCEGKRVYVRDVCRAAGMGTGVRENISRERLYATARALRDGGLRVRIVSGKQVVEIS